MRTNAWWFYKFSEVDERIQKFAKGLENRHHRKVDIHVVVASYVICFQHGMGLIGSILVFNFQGLSI